MSTASFWSPQRVKNIPAGGDLLEVVVKKPRWRCAEPACGRRTFVQVTYQLPFRARCLTQPATTTAAIPVTVVSIAAAQTVA